MADKRKRVQELNMLLAKRKDYVRNLQTELELAQLDIKNFNLELFHLLITNTTGE